MPLVRSHQTVIDFKMYLVKNTYLHDLELQDI
nr:CPPV178 hypothetical protein [Cooks petrelpox virus]